MQRPLSDGLFWRVSDGQHRVVSYILALLFRGFLGVSHSNGCCKGKVMLSKQMFHYIAVYESFNDLVTDVFLAHASEQKLHVLVSSLNESK